MLRLRRCRAPARPVPRVQPLGRRDVRRPLACSPSAWCRCSTSTVRSRTRERAAEQGFRALFLPAQVPQRPYNDGAYDRVLGGRPGPRAPTHLPLRHRSRAARRARPGRRGRQLPDGRAARRADGAAHDGRRRRARPLPGAAARHGGDRCVLAGVDHDAGRRDLRGPRDVREPEALAEAERAHPATVRGDLHVRPGRDQQPRDHRCRDAHVGQRLPTPGGHVARNRRPWRSISSTACPTTSCTRSWPAMRPTSSASTSIVSPSAFPPDQLPHPSRGAALSRARQA